MEIEQNATVLSSLQFATPSSARLINCRSNSIQTSDELSNHIRLRPLRLLTIPPQNLLHLRQSHIQMFRLLLSQSWHQYLEVSYAMGYLQS